MLGMAWVTLKNGSRRKAVIQKITLEAKPGPEVLIRMSGFLLHNPEETFTDAEVVGRFTPLGGLYKALAKLFVERENRSLLDRAHNYHVRFVSNLLAMHKEGPTFAYRA